MGLFVAADCRGNPCRLCRSFALDVWVDVGAWKVGASFVVTTFVLCFTATRREDFSKSIRSDYISCTALVGVISVDLCAWFCHDACCEYQWSMVIAIATCARASRFFSENGYYSHKQAGSCPIWMKICDTKTIPCYLWSLGLRWSVHARHT
jgi:hypothetical protein